MKHVRLAAILLGAAIVSMLPGVPPPLEFDVWADDAPPNHHHPSDAHLYRDFLQNVTSETVAASPDTTCLITLSGDVNNSNTVSSADIITLVTYCFKSGPEPLPCEAAGDVNCDGAVTASDIIVEVNYCFKGGSPPCDICYNSPLTSSCN